jgi:hypothetical protein
VKHLKSFLSFFHPSAASSAARRTSVVLHCNLAVDPVRTNVHGNLSRSLIEGCFFRLDWRWWGCSVPDRFVNEALPVADFFGSLLGFCAVRFA